MGKRGWKIRFKKWTFESYSAKATIAGLTGISMYFFVQGFKNSNVWCMCFGALLLTGLGTLSYAKRDSEQKQLQEQLRYQVKDIANQPQLNI